MTENTEPAPTGATATEEAPEAPVGDTPAVEPETVEGDVAEGDGSQETPDEPSTETPAPELVIGEDSPLRMAAEFDQDSYLEGVNAYAEENGLSAEATAAVVQRDEKAQSDFYAWGNSNLETLKTDPTYGGDNLDRTRENFAKGLQSVFPQLAEQIKNSPYGNWIEFVGPLADIGASLGEPEGFAPPGSENSGSDTTPTWESLWPESSKPGQ